jgi:hypothetical protein
MTIKGQELEMALGLPIDITCFIDNLPRRCYPYVMADLYKANTYLSFFDHSDMVGNMQEEEKSVAMMCFLAESFRDTDLEELMKNISVSGFPDLIADIKAVNGMTDANGEKDIDKTKESVEWKTSICAIQAYTSNTYEDIRNMTLTQFSNLLNYIGKKINWEYKTGIIDMVSEPNKFIDPGEHPLANSGKAPVKKDHMTMKDVMALKGLEGGGK